MIHDISHREAVIEVNKILTNHEMTRALSEIYGPTVNRYLESWLKNVASGQVEPVDARDVMLRHLRVGMSMAEMGFSMRTSIVQFLGLTNTVARVGAVRTLRGVKNMLASQNMEHKISRINERSTYMRDRTKTFDREVADARRGLDPSDWKQGLYAAAFWQIAKLDAVVSYATWIASYDQAIDQGKSDADAITFADMIVRETQSSGMAKDLAEIQRGGETSKLFTAFYTFFAAYQNMVFDAYQNTKVKAVTDGKLAATAYAANQFFWLVAAPSLLSAAILDGGPEDDEEWWSWASKIVAGYGFSGLVGIRDLAGGLTSDFGYSAPPAFRAVETVADALKRGASGDIENEAFWRSTVMGLGYLTHMPSRQMWRGIESITELNDGSMEPHEAIANFMGMRHFK